MRLSLLAAALALPAVQACIIIDSGPGWDGDWDDDGWNDDGWDCLEACDAPVDSDGDGLSDEDEGRCDTDPQNPDSDGDGIDDGDEDRDDDGATNEEECENGSDPADGDVWTEGEHTICWSGLTGTCSFSSENIFIEALDASGCVEGVVGDASIDCTQDDGPDEEPPPPADRDGDGLSDDEEDARGTDPDVWDTDGDGQCDGAEVECGSSPLDPFFVCG